MIVVVFCNYDSDINTILLVTAEVAKRCPLKNMSLKILQNLQKNTCVGVLLFNKAAGWKTWNFKKPASCEFRKIFKTFF